MKYASLLQTCSTARNIGLVWENSGSYVFIMWQGSVAPNVLSESKQLYSIADAGWNLQAFIGDATGGALYFSVGGIDFEV